MKVTPAKTRLNRLASAKLIVSLAWTSPRATAWSPAGAAAHSAPSDPEHPSIAACRVRDWSCDLERTVCGRHSDLLLASQPYRPGSGSEDRAGGSAPQQGDGVQQDAHAGRAQRPDGQGAGLPGPPVGRLTAAAPAPGPRCFVQRAAAATSPWVSSSRARCAGTGLSRLTTPGPGA